MKGEWRRAVHKYKDPKTFLANLIEGEGGQEKMSTTGDGFNIKLRYLYFNFGMVRFKPEAYDVWDYHFGACSTFKYESSAV